MRIALTVGSFANRVLTREVMVASSTSYARTIMQLAAKARVPVIYPSKEYVQNGALLFYGPSLEDECRRAAHFIDEILKGAMPSSLPYRAAQQIRVGHQSENRQSAPHHHP